MRKPRQQLVSPGDRFHSLTAILIAGYGVRGDVYWVVRCDCGKQKTVSQISLRKRAKSCGCVRGHNNGPTGSRHPAWKGKAANDTTKRERARKWISPKGKRCEKCARAAYDIWHRDGSIDNNDPSNLGVLCRRCKMEIDGRLALLKAMPKKKPTFIPCSNCPRKIKKGRALWGRCHTCAEYYRRTGIERPLHGRRDGQVGPGIDLEYRVSVRALGCLLASTGDCFGPMHAHHAGVKPGKNMKALDSTCICLCQRHHIAELHGLCGYFKGWQRHELREWQDRKIADTQAVLSTVSTDPIPAWF